MTAREMFEKLRYDCELGKYYIEYYCEDEDGYKWKKIYFNTKDRDFHADEDFESMSIDTKTLAAICQQVKELGWLDD